MGQIVKFKRKTTDEIDNLPVEDGSLIYNTENGKTYMDYKDKRIPTGGGANGGIYVGDVEPEDPDITLWIPEEVSKTKASEVVDSLDGNATNFAPSVRAVNEMRGKILWENPNPTTGIGSGTIQLDLSNVKVIMISCKIRSGSLDERVSLIVEVGKQSHIQHLDSSSNVVRLWHRTVIVNTNNLIFDEAYINDSEKRDDLLIPMSIIKIM